MNRSPAWTALVVVALLATACGGSRSSAFDSTTTTSATSTTTTTTAPTTTTTATTTTTTTTTTTAPPTTTTTTLPPAIPVVGWEGEGIRNLQIEVAIEPPANASALEWMARTDLEMVGVDAVDESDVLLTFTLQGTALSAYYDDAGRCYTGARVTGTAVLAAADRPQLDSWLSGEIPVPWVIFGCGADPSDAPFADAFEKGLLGVATDLWGPAAAPLLIQVVQREVTDSEVDLALKAIALNEFRGLEAGLIPFQQQRTLLDATIDLVEYLVDSGVTPEGADEAARRVLTRYAGTNYGLATMEDVAEWRAWLEDWAAQAGG